MEIINQLKAISDETRLKIIVLLLNKNYCVRALSKKLDISESAVSQHIKILKDSGLVIGEKRSYWVHYRVQEENLYQIGDEVKDLKNYPLSVGKCNNTNCSKNKGTK